MVDTAEWLAPEAQAFLERVRGSIANQSPRLIAAHVADLTKQAEDYLDHSVVNLYAGSNALSPAVRRVLGSSIGMRPTEGHPGDRYQEFGDALDEIQALAIELAQQIFHAQFAEVRALSGTMANAIVLNALTQPGDTILSLPISAGGPISHQKIGYAGYRKLKIKVMPLTLDGWEIDLDGLRQLIRSASPRLIMLGSRLILFPYALKEIRAFADRAEARIVYDAGHVAGLIAGGKFQDPLAEGADVLTTCTHKTFGGPPGGLIVTNDAELAQKIDRATFPGMTANFHLNRVAALAIAEAELLHFAKDYAQACLANAQTFARALETRGIVPCARDRGFTASHQLALDAKPWGGGNATAKKLAQAHIITSKHLLPGDSPKLGHDPSGLRLAVHEVTRWGMGQSQMEEIAAFFHQVLIEGRKPELVRTAAMALKQRFNKVQYAF